MVTEAQKNATRKYNKNNYDRLELVVPKGKKELLKEHATKQGKSINQFIIDCINAQCDILKSGN